MDRAREKKPQKPPSQRNLFLHSTRRVSVYSPETPCVLHIRQRLMHVAETTSLGFIPLNLYPDISLDT